MKKTAAVLTLAAGAALVPAGTALAEQSPVLVETHGAHSVYVSPSEPYDVQDKTTYWDFVPLDGMCGFVQPTLELSDMRETFFIQTHRDGSTTGTGKLLDETFELTERAPDGTPLRTFHGQGDEYAQMSGTATGDMALVNLRVVFRGTSEDGRHLSFTIAARLRTDRRTGELTRMDGHVQTCAVR